MAVCGCEINRTVSGCSGNTRPHLLSDLAPAPGRSSLAAIDTRRASRQLPRPIPQLEAPVDDATIPKNHQNPRCFWLTADVHACTVVTVAGRDLNQVAKAEPPAGCIPPPPVGSWNAGPQHKGPDNMPQFRSLLCSLGFIFSTPDRSSFQIAHSVRNLERRHLPGIGVFARLEG
jgi:hypothetical protein